MKIKEIRTRGAESIPARSRISELEPDSSLERMLRFGPRVLGDAELVSLVLGPGGPVSASAVSRRLLARWGSVTALAAQSPQALCRTHGMGLARAVRLTAAMEFGFRCRCPGRRTGLKVNGPDDLLPLLAEEFRGLDREHFLALYLDARHRVVAVETVSIGSLNASLVHPREVFKPAVALGVAAVIAAHNHPSGNTRPSGDDLELTARLARCGRLLGIELLDHIVFADEQLVSIRQYGWPGSSERRERTSPGG